jgi:ABC-type transport system involved in cytochrome c biogenesis permease subunit
VNAVNAFVARTIKWFLIVAGLITCLTLPFVLDINLFTPMLGGLIDYTPSSVPALRHWGIMIFALGVLMISAAFRPWLRFETLLFSTAEKAFIAYLFFSNLGQPWVMGYFGAFVDSAIAAYGILYFLSDQGRPEQWVVRSMADHP